MENRTVRDVIAEHLGEEAAEELLARLKPVVEKGASAEEIENVFVDEMVNLIETRMAVALAAAIAPGIRAGLKPGIRAGTEIGKVGAGAGIGAKVGTSYPDAQLHDGGA